MTWFLYYLMLILPIDLGSAIVGKLFRFLGPQLPINKRAKTHLKSCFPHWNAIELEANIRDMWENLGRTTAEFPHIQKLDVSGSVHIDANIFDSDNNPGQSGYYLSRDADGILSLIHI